MKTTIPDLQGQKILAVDFGTKATGLALFAPGDPYPRPYDTVPYRSDDQLIKAIKQVVRDEGVSIVVLGMPRFLDGKPSSMTARGRGFQRTIGRSPCSPAAFSTGRSALKHGSPRAHARIRSLQLQGRPCQN